jgi:hypothetical protein
MTESIAANRADKGGRRRAKLKHYKKRQPRIRTRRRQAAFSNDPGN